MNFLLRYSLGFDLLSLFILLVYTCITKPFGYIGNHDGVDTLVIMPVTTRAQARLLTGSSTELSTAISTGTRVLSTTRSTGIKVLSELYHRLKYFKFRNLKFLEILKMLSSKFQILRYLYL